MQDQKSPRSRTVAHARRKNVEVLRIPPEVAPQSEQQRALEGCLRRLIVEHGNRQQESNSLRAELMGEQEVLPLLGCTAAGGAEASVSNLGGVGRPPRDDATVRTGAEPGGA